MDWNMIVLTILTIVVHQQLTARRSDLLDLKQKDLHLYLNIQERILAKYQQLIFSVI